jgi:lysozyme family protein
VTFDGAVNSGQIQGAKWLQEALGVPVDGHVGPVTLTAALACDPTKVINAACDLRLAAMHTFRDKQGNLSWLEYGAGWQARVDKVRAAALQMVQAAATPAPQPALPAPQAVTQAPTTPAPAPNSHPGHGGLWGALLHNMGLAL